jgi:hypothetical protein
VSLALAESEDVRERTGKSPEAASATAVASGPPCRTGVVTYREPSFPPNHSTKDNPTSAGIALLKDCDGMVLATFTTEALVGDFIHLDMYATCVATAGQSNPCKVGRVVKADPGHMILSENVPAISTHTVTMLWPDLKKGKWQFQVRAGGGGFSLLGFRTFVVQIYE